MPCGPKKVNVGEDFTMKFEYKVPTNANKNWVSVWKFTN